MEGAFEQRSAACSMIRIEMDGQGHTLRAAGGGSETQRTGRRPRSVAGGRGRQPPSEGDNTYRT